MTNITIFTTCAPFKGDRAKIQKNAIQSWLNIKPTPEILIMGGKEQGVKQFASEHDIQIIETDYKKYIINIYDFPPNINPHMVISPPDQTPVSNIMFKKARENAKNDILCFTSSDIIHLQGLITGITALKNTFQGDYLATGRRYDIDFEITPEIIKNPEILAQIALYHGKLHGPGANDYLIFPRNMEWPNMPPLSVACPGLDAWMCINTLERKIPLIDCTEIIKVIHQKHEKPKKTIEKIFQNRHNIWLLGPQYWKATYKGITKHATHHLERRI